MALQEINIYGRDNSLFKNILKQSQTIGGRYFVSPNYGAELNTSNLEQFLRDDKYGLTDVKQKYPICICLTPVSRLVKVNGYKWEQFFFILFFLTTDGRDGANQIKKLDKATNTSGQHVWYDWNDMKIAAANFLEVLHNLNRSPLPQHIRLRQSFSLDDDRNDIKRVTKVNNDMLNGVSLSFSAYIQTDACLLSDYNEGYLNEILIQ